MPDLNTIEVKRWDKEIKGTIVHFYDKGDVEGFNFHLEGDSIPYGYYQKKIEKCASDLIPK